MASSDNVEPDIHHLGDIDAEALTPVVRRALGGPDLAIEDWTVKPLGYPNIDPELRGLFRVAGTASDVNGSQPWSIVLKTFVRPTSASPELEAPTHYTYWEREPLAYESALLEDLPDGFRAARCYGVHRPSLSAAWVWLEDLADLYPDGWPLQRYALAARHLGGFNGAYPSRKPLPSEPWFADARSRLVQYSASNPDFGPQVVAFLASDEPLRDRRVQKAFGDGSEVAALVDWYAHEELVVDRLLGLPRTFCHGDPIGPNLFAQRSAQGRDETVAIDWALTGLGPMGGDLAHLVGGSLGFFRVSVADADELERLSVEAYLDGLADADGPVDQRMVRLAYLGTLLLSWGAVAGFWLQAALDTSRTDWVERFWSRPVATVIEGYAPLVPWLGKRAQELRGS